MSKYLILKKNGSRLQGEKQEEKTNKYCRNSYLWRVGVVYFSEDGGRTQENLEA